MHQTESWEKMFPPPIANFSRHEANYICHSDGGTRAGSCSAAGWILEAVVMRGNETINFPVAMKGVYIKDPVSSLFVKAIASEEAIIFITSRLGKICAK